MSSSTTNNLRFILLALILLLGLIAAVLLVPRLLSKPPPNDNALNLGQAAPSSEIDLVIRPPIDFDFMTKDQVLQLRSEAVYWYPDLIVGEYKPAESIFGQIVDGLPWWGVAGQFYYGQGDESIEGPAEESRFILNPFLLVAAEPHTFWDRSVVSETQIRKPGFTFYCEPTRLRWRPQAASAEVHYSAECAARLGYGYFDLISYNARDFNLNYIYVSYSDSVNINKSPQPTGAYAIPHYIHQGGSCGYPGGCNNMSPPTPPIDALEITGYPAQVVIWLWRDLPDSPDESPDMVYVIRIQ
jgi:hypothetical protein